MVNKQKIIQIDDTGPLTSKKKKRKGIITLISVIALAGVVISIIYTTTKTNVKVIGDFTIATATSGSLTTTTEASGSVILPTQVSIVTTEEGYASELYVSEGDTINQSTILAKIEVPDIEEEYYDLNNSLETEQLNLEEMEISQEYSEIETTSSLQRLEIEIEESIKNLEDEKTLLDLSSSRLSSYEAAQDQLVQLQYEKEDLLLAIEKERVQSEITLRKQNLKISQLEISIDRIASDINNANIRSPINGEILSINPDLAVPGSLIKQSTELFIVADRENIYIDLEVYEQYSSYLQEGDVMELLISSNIIKAEIYSIGSIASLSSDGLAATVTVRAKPIENYNLTPGASAVGSIPLGTKEDALLLPRGAYLTTGNQIYVYKVTGDKARRVEVTFGDIQGNLVEVLEGLEPGDEVIISSYQNFIDQEIIELK